MEDNKDLEIMEDGGRAFSSSLALARRPTIPTKQTNGRKKDALSQELTDER